MHELYDLKEMLCKKLEEYGKKNDVTSNSLEIIDKLAHAIKNIDKIISAKEDSDGGYSGRYSYAGMGDGRGRSMMRTDGDRGRYSRTGDMEDMAHTLGRMMSDLPDDLKGDAERLLRKMDKMM